MTRETTLNSQPRYDLSIIVPLYHEEENVQLLHERDLRGGAAARAADRDRVRRRRQQGPHLRALPRAAAHRPRPARRQVPPQRRADRGHGRGHRPCARRGADHHGRRPAERSAGHPAVPGEDRRGLRPRRRLAPRPPGPLVAGAAVQGRQLADRQGHRRADQGQWLLAQGLPRRPDQEHPALQRDAPLHPGDGLAGGAPDRRRSRCATIRAGSASRNTASRGSTRCSSIW